MNARLSALTVFSYPHKLCTLKTCGKAIWRDRIYKKVTWGEGEGENGKSFNGCSFRSKWGKVLAMDSGDGCSTSNAFLPLYRTRKNGKDCKFWYARNVCYHKFFNNLWGIKSVPSLPLHPQRLVGAKPPLGVFQVTVITLSGVHGDQDDALKLLSHLWKPSTRDRPQTNTRKGVGSLEVGEPT